MVAALPMAAPPASARRAQDRVWPVRRADGAHATSGHPSAGATDHPRGARKPKARRHLEDLARNLEGQDSGSGVGSRREVE